MNSKNKLFQQTFTQWHFNLEPAWLKELSMDIGPQWLQSVIFRSACPASSLRQCHGGLGETGAM